MFIRQVQNFLDNPLNLSNKNDQDLENFCFYSDDIIRKVANNFKIENERIFYKTRKLESLFPRQLSIYKITRENEKTFGKKYPCLTAKIFYECNYNHSNVLHSDNKISGQINLPTPEGKKIREVLKLFE